ncbi:MAG: DEAD/DEAH box helicase [Spirochaetales bacterium]|nr:DEAD/DEAH box helicase [Spirochaetales bacterium]
MTFEELGLCPEILRALKSRGYKTATAIQAQAIPAILKKNDVLGGAQTGTGKTAAFALPILEKLSHEKSKTKHPKVLVLTPTRELADQVTESFISYGQNLDVRSIKIYGGVGISKQISTLRKGCDVVIATPGRLLDHLSQKTIDMKMIHTLVLDEADRMLDMGFIHDIKRIIKYLPNKRQNLLFSATYAKEIMALANSILDNPVSIEVARRNTAAEKVIQKLHYVEKNRKRDLLIHLIKEKGWFQVLVFVKMKHAASRLAKQLEKAGIPSAAIHGDKSQGARTRALKEFKTGEIQALIATDIAARGIQIDNLDQVVNFDLPQVPEDYIHRIGRTGRAGLSGNAVSFVSQEEHSILKRIEKLLEKPIPDEKIDGFDAGDVYPSIRKDSGNTGNRNKGKSDNPAFGKVQGGHRGRSRKKSAQISSRQKGQNNWGKK